MGRYPTETYMNFNLRVATSSDAGSISDIYNYYVDNSTCTFDVVHESLTDRIGWLELHGPRHPAIVCTASESVVGWGSLSEWNPRPAYSHTAEVSFYVHHEWHRRGIGRRLLADLIERARSLGLHVLIGGACTEMVASIALQESFGFEKVAHFKEVGNKFGRWLDVGYYQLNLSLP